ncbi:MAG: hypothetical protein HFJ38_05285 [Bacilli bacterium]|nr:hypothetical protein [Bacilli bacterium]
MINKIKNWINLCKEERRENERKYGKRKPSPIESLFNKQKRKQRKKIEGVYKDLLKDYNDLVYEIGLSLEKLKYYREKIETNEIRLSLEKRKQHKNETEEIKIKMEYTINIAFLESCKERCIQTIKKKQRKLTELKPALQKYSWLNKKKVPTDDYFDFCLPKQEENLEQMTQEEKDRLAYQELYQLFDQNGKLKTRRKSKKIKKELTQIPTIMNEEENKIEQYQDDKSPVPTVISIDTQKPKELIFMIEPNEEIEYINLNPSISQKNQQKMKELEIKIIKYFYKKYIKETKKNLLEDSKGKVEETKVNLLEDKKRKLEDELIKKAIRDFEYNLSTVKQKQKLRETAIEMLEKKYSEEKVQKKSDKLQQEEKVELNNNINNEETSCEIEVRNIFNKIIAIYEIIEEKYHIKEYEQTKLTIMDAYEEKLSALKIKYQVEAYKEECKKAEESYKDPQLNSFLLAVKQTIKERYEKEYHISEFHERSMELKKNKQKIDSIIENKYHITEFSQHEKLLKEYTTKEYQKIIDKYGIKKFKIEWEKIQKENELAEKEKIKKK